MPATFGSKVIVIRKSEFVAETQFLFWNLLSQQVCRLLNVDDYTKYRSKHN